MVIITSPAFAKIEVKQEVKTEKATYSCYGKTCERTEGKEEIGVNFSYVSITTSNSGKSSSKRHYKCTTNEKGASCKAI